MLSLALSACEEVPAKTNWMRQARLMGVALLMPRQLACICCSLCVLSQLACIFLPAAVALARALGHDSAVMHLYSNTLGFVAFRQQSFKSSFVPQLGNRELASVFLLVGQSCTSWLCEHQTHLLVGCFILQYLTVLFLLFILSLTCLNS